LYHGVDQNWGSGYGISDPLTRGVALPMSRDVILRLQRRVFANNQKIQSTSWTVYFLMAGTFR